MNIDDMSNQELDDLLAEEVMKWHRYINAHGQESWANDESSYAVSTHDWQPTMRISQADRVLSRLEREECDTSVWTRRADGTIIHYSRIVERERAVEASAATRPLAISRACGEVVLTRRPKPTKWERAADKLIEAGYLSNFAHRRDRDEMARIIQQAVEDDAAHAVQLKSQGAGDKA